MSLGKFDSLLQELTIYKWKGTFYQQLIGKEGLTSKDVAYQTITKGQITPAKSAILAKKEATKSLLNTTVLKNHWVSLVEGYFLKSDGKFPEFPAFGDAAGKNSKPTGTEILAYIANVKSSSPVAYEALTKFFNTSPTGVVPAQEANPAGERGLLGYARVSYAATQSSSTTGRTKALNMVALMGTNPSKYNIKDNIFTQEVLGYIQVLVKGLIGKYPAGQAPAPYSKQADTEISALVATKVTNASSPAYVLGYKNASGKENAAQETEILLRTIQKELDYSTVEGLKKSKTIVDKYLADPQINQAAKKELTQIQKKITAEITSKEASAAASSKKAKEAPGANPSNPTNKAAGPAKESVEAQNAANGVSKEDTKDGGGNTSRPEEKINAALQVIPPSAEELAATPLTLALTLQDPLGKLASDPFYRTQLVNTDLNDFRRVQLILPNNLNQGPGNQSPIASFKLVNDANSGKIFTGDEGAVPTFDNPLAGGAIYNQFFLKAVDETRNEKFQMVDTPAMGQTLFGFGEKPEFWTIRGQVLNDSLNDWTTKLRLAWANRMRISQLIEHGQYLELTVPAIRLVIGCYPVALTISHVDDAETLPSFAMVLFKRHESIMPVVSYSRQEAVVAMINSVLSLDKRSVNLASGQLLTPTETAASVLDGFTEGANTGSLGPLLTGGN